MPSPSPSRRREGDLTVRTRIIPCLDVANGRVVKGVNFVDLADAGDPVDARVTVRRVRRDAVQSFGSSVVPLGDCAVIETAGIEVVLNSNRAQAFSPDLFTNLGVEIDAKQALVVKSTNHFHGAFARIATRILYAAVDGPYPSDPRRNAYRRLTRPIWPIVDTPHQTQENA